MFRKVMSLLLLFVLLAGLVALGSGCKKKKYILGSFNVAPEIEDIPDQAATEGSAFVFDLSPYVSDNLDDVDELTFTMISSKGSFTGSTYLNTFTTPGTETVSFSVTDTEGLTGTSFFTVVVSPWTDDPPVVAIPDQNATLQYAFVLDVSGLISDDHDAVSDLALAVTSGEGLFIGTVYTASYDTLGVHTIQVTVTDTASQATTDSFDVTVVEPTPLNVPPEIEPIPQQNATELAPFTLDLTTYVSDDRTAQVDLVLGAVLGGGSFSGLVYSNTFETTGLKTIQFIVMDEEGLSSTGYFDVDVAEMANSAPVVGTILPQTAVIGYSFVLDVSGYVTDDNDAVEDLTYAVTSGAGQFIGMVYTYTYDTTGLRTVNFSVTDTRGLSSPGTFDIDVVEPSPLNDPPVIGVIGLQSVDEGVPFQLDLAGFVSDDEDSDAELTFAVTGGGGRFNGSLYEHTFDTPGDGQTIEFVVMDSEGLSTVGWFVIDVGDLNEAPTITLPIDTQTGALNFTFVYDLAGWVQDVPDPDEKLILAVTSGGGSFTGTVYTNVFTTAGTHTIQFSVTDTRGLSNTTGTFDVTVSDPINHAPVINPNPVTGMPGATETIPYSENLLSHCTIVDDRDNVDQMIYAVISGGGYFEVVDNTEVNYVNDSFTTPGLHTIGFVVMDTEGLSTPGSFDVDVAAAPNSAPVISAIPTQVANVNYTFAVDLGWWVADDHDADDDLTFVVTGGDGAFTGTVYSWTYATTGPAFQVDFRVTDTEGAFSDGTFFIDVRDNAPANMPPSVGSIPGQNVDERVELSLNVATWVTDETPGSLRFVVTSGEGSFAGGGSTYSHTFMAPGDYTIGFIVIDVEGASGPGTFDVTVAEDNDAPEFENLPISPPAAALDNLYTFNLANNVRDNQDPDEDLVLTVDSGGGIFVGTVYTNTFTTVGTHAVGFTVTDTRGLSVSGSFNVDVSDPINRPPVINPSHLTVAGTWDEGVPYSLELGGYITDEDDDGDLVLTVISGGGSFTDTEYNNTFDSPGLHVVEYVVTDTAGLSTQGSFEVDVASTNTAPSIVNTPIPVQDAALDFTFVFDLAYYVDDEDADEDLTLTVTGGGEGFFTGTVYVNTFATTGSHTVNFRVTDTRGAFVESSFSVDVSDPINHPPVINPNPVTGMPDAEETVPYSENLLGHCTIVDDRDPTDQMTYTVISGGGYFVVVSDTEVNYVSDSFTAPATTPVSATVDFVVTDTEGLSTPGSFTLTVQPRPGDTAPVISAIPQQKATLKAPFIFDLSPYVTDDYDPIEDLVFSAVDPSSASFSGPLYIFTFSEYEVGTHLVEFGVMDTKGLYTTGIFEVLLAGDIWYVDDAAGDDANSGVSWLYAFKSLAWALKEAGSQDIILVADGTYSGEWNTELDFHGSAISMKVVNKYGSDYATIDCEGLGCGFRFEHSEPRSAEIRNFIIINGDSATGGGIHCSPGLFGGSKPTIVNCTIDGCESTGDGGGIYLDDSDPILIDCTVINCSATGNGGGIYCVNGSAAPLMVNCVVTDNEAGGDGGGIYWSGCADHLILNDIPLTGNTAGVSGGGIYYNPGGGAYNLTLTNCPLTLSTATSGDGGAIYCESAGAVNLTGILLDNSQAGSSGGAICCVDSTSLTISGCSMTFCHANGGDGGGIYCDISGTLTVTDTPVDDNTADGSGGGIYFTSTGGALVLNGPSVDRNTATGGGGGVYCDDSTSVTISNCSVSGNDADGAGGGIDCSWCDGGLTLTACTVDGNTSTDQGGGIYCDLGGVLSITNGSVGGNTANSNGGGIYVDGVSSVTITDCPIDRNISTTGSGGGYCQETMGNVSISGSSIGGNIASAGGGGIYYYGGSDLTLTDCSVDANNAGPAGSGGGIHFNSSSTLSISGGSVGQLGSSNVAGGSGGGIYLYLSGSLTVSNCPVDSNTASTGWGGGIYCGDSPGFLYLEGPSSVNGNTAAQSGGGIYSDNCGDMEVFSCAVDGNTASSGSGGGIYTAGSGYTAIYGASPTVSNNTASQSGGGIYSEDSADLYLDPCTVDNNEAINGDGGGVYYTGSYLYMWMSAVTNNTANNAGGGVYFSSSPPGGAIVADESSVSGNTAVNYAGGGMYCANSNVILYGDSTVSGNSALDSSGGGLFCEDCDTEIWETTFDNNYAFETGGAMHLDEDAAPLIIDSVVTNGTAGFAGGGIFCVFPGWGDSPMISGCTVATNTAGYFGGGICCFYADDIFEVDGCTITNNSAIAPDDGYGNVGGGMFFAWMSPPVVVSDCTVTSNLAVDGGGGIYFHDCGIIAVVSTGGSCLVSSNRATTPGVGVGCGGGICINRYDTGWCEVWLGGVTIEHNQADLDGGGLYLTNQGIDWDGAPTASPGMLYFPTPVDTCTVSNNTAGRDGGGICLIGSMAPIPGFDALEVGSLLSCNITDNTATNGSGGGIYMVSVGPSVMTPPGVELNSCQVTGNTSAQDGGGIYCEYVYEGLRVLGGSVGSNTAGNRGGGIFCDDVAAGLYVSGCSITDNEATLIAGGGIGCFFSGDLTVEGNSFVDSNTTGGIGGGIAYSTCPGYLTLDSSSLSNNTAGTWGGGIQCVNCSGGGGSVSDCTIDGNVATAAYGGGISFIDSGDLDVSGGSISGNTCDDGGGGIRFIDATGNLTVADCQIDGNGVTNGPGGGICCDAADTMSVSGGSVGTPGSGNSAAGAGGGIYCVSTNTLDITGCELAENIGGDSGGGVYCEIAGDVTVAGGSIHDNTAAMGGGGMYCIGGANLTLTSCPVTGNEAQFGQGGGVYCNVANDLSIDGGQVSSNTASSAGGGVYCTTSDNMIVGAVTIADNVSGNYGGGVYCLNTALMITTSNITGNTCAVNEGGGVYCANALTTVVRYTTILGNTAEGSGGGMWIIYNPPGDLDPAYDVDIANCLIVKNTSLATAAGPDVGGGGGICFRGDLNILMTNCTLSDNVAWVGGGLSFIRLQDYAGSNAEVYNTILWHNDALYDDGTPDHKEGDEVFDRGDFPVNLEYCALPNTSPPPDGEPERFGGYNPNSYDAIVMQPSCFEMTNAFFIDPASNNYRLNNVFPSFSACIDGGNNPAAISAGLDLIGDLDLNPRIVDGDGDPEAGGNDTVDVGAYEAPPWP